MGMLVLSCMRCSQNTVCLYSKKSIPMEIWDDQKKVCVENQVA